ncbi:MAG: circularly permuted type 2 ATP-grasp protein [Desulforhopalus sp.]
MSDTEQIGSTAAKEKIPSIFDTVPFPENGYCEYYFSPESPRQQWQSIVAAFDTMGVETLARHHDKAKRMRHEDGATINPFDDLTERSTSWALDLIPLVISASEWVTIETGLKQRAQLLEKILADTYGPQELLKSRMIPAELIFANPNFLHQCHGIKPSGNRHLTCYAADLYRGPDGKFRVLRDYGSQPPGLGYALENRIVMSRVLSDLYHKTQIRRLAPFFQTFHQAIIQRASLRKEDPGIVIFSPGPDSRIYFEHALLSRYLGYPLVEGQDLTVRNGRVFLKKLGGLEPVEAIFRQVSDRQCDPFALRRKASSGVAGLIQVCREQNIDIVNPVGSGFIDTPALTTFLPSLSRYLTGQELLLENHPAWWCGEDEGLRRAETGPDQLTIGPALNQEMAVQGSADISLQLKNNPAQYMASTPLAPSVSLSWATHGATRCYTILRVFLCATKRGFAVMPGGLAISAGDVETLGNDNPELQQSKDVWVLSDKPVIPFSLMEDFHSIPEFRRSSDLPSRVADNLMWLGRYLERAEGMLRLLRPVYQRLSGENRPEDIPELQFLVNILQERNIVPRPPDTEMAFFHHRNWFQQLHEALYSKDREESIVSIIQRVQVTARNVRDRLSVDSTRAINRLEDFADGRTGDQLELLDETLFALNAFSGLAMESMTQGLGWRFMDMGRRMERALHQATIIRIALPHVCNDAHNTLQALLEISDSLMTYRSRYRSTFQLSPVLDLLLSDEGNPKSLAFQFSRLAGHVEHLPRQSEKRFSCAEERLALEMLTAARLLDLTKIQCEEEHIANDSLTTFLVTMENRLKEFSQQVSGHYLTRVPPTPHFTLISDDRDE